ncbi:hypothetical protein G7046_g1822 [Stylonectria norvegica]|nr:hypothetical protein G7046_g1822 [Stylonectria norvegica]
MASWLTSPLQLTGSREFTCDGFTEEQCEYYMQRWHFWYIADHVYALPTIAFFMSALGLFIIGNFVSQQLFHIKALRWNSAPLGILLLGAAGTIFFFCMDLIPQPYYWSTLDFGGSPPLGTRSGWLALACMPFVFATASKTNWITLATGVSHERLQVFHRWISYAFFLLALLHTFPFIVYHIRFHDMVMQWEMSNLFYWTGIVALIFQAWLTFASHSLVRNLGYEWFKAAHFLGAAVFIVIFFWHCDYTLTSWHYFIATAAIYVPCFLYSWIRTFFEYGITQKAYIHVEDNAFTRITIPSVGFKWKPGQHCFLRFTSFGIHAFSSHPFTICSLPSTGAAEKSELVFYIRHQRGLTEKLYNLGLQQPGSSVPVLIDGPYGGVNTQRIVEGDRLLVVAGGSGAGWLLPFIELFQRRASLSAHEECGQATNAEEKNAQSSASRYRGRNTPSYASLRVILAVRDTSSRVWFLRTLGELLSRYSTSASLCDIDVEVYLTGEADQNTDLVKSVEKGTDTVASTPRAENDTGSESRETKVLVKELHGRPELPLVIREEGGRASQDGGSLSVFVCGPETMQSDVSNAVARENLSILKDSTSGGVYLHVEHFSWA